MRTEQSLRDAYSELAASAPSTHELLHPFPGAGRRSATRWYVLAVAAAVAVLAAGATLLIRNFAADGPNGPAAPTAPVVASSTSAPTGGRTTGAPGSPAASTSPSGAASDAPTALGFSFAVTPNDTWSASLNEISSDGEQHAAVELTADPTVSGTVSVRPDRSYAELKPDTGVPVTIDSRTTGYLFGQKGSGSGTSRLIWPYSDNGWALVQLDFGHPLTAADRARMIALARHVTPAESLPRAPFRLPYVPGGLTPTSYLAVGSGISVGFIDAAGPALRVSLEPEGAHGCPGAGAADRYGSSLVLAGHTGCRISAENPDGPPVELRLDIPGGALIVAVDQTGSAGHVGAYSEDDLTRILAEAVLTGTPNDPKTWGELTF